MTIIELNKELLEAYSETSLNKITLVLINLFKNRQFSTLQRIADLLSDFVNIKISDSGKGFSGFMMLYHPDRANIHIKEINRLTDQNDFNGLLGYSHILRLERVDEIASSIISYEDIDYSPVYEWDFETEGFTILYDDQPVEIVKTKTNTKLLGYTFYDAVKIREYGHTEIEFPSYYLEDIEEFELSSSDINDLDGVQFCIHARTLDLSNNRITDLSPLAGLNNLEELDLSDNQIENIDVISNLINLKSIILSNNPFEDISPLLELENLMFVDLSGNNITPEHISWLSERGITINNF